jgi:hypothetical protein
MEIKINIIFNKANILKHLALKFTFIDLTIANEESWKLYSPY